MIELAHRYGGQGGVSTNTNSTRAAAQLSMAPSVRRLRALAGTMAPVQEGYVVEITAQPPATIAAGKPFDVRLLIRSSETALGTERDHDLAQMRVIASPARV